MNVYSNIEKHWRRFPSLHAVISDKSIPDDYNRHLGLRSPCTTVFDDLHDIAEISVIVAANQDKIAEAATSSSHPSSGKDRAVWENFMRDLEHLHGATRAFANFFEERAEEIQKVRHEMYAAKQKKAMAEEPQGRNEDNFDQEQNTDEQAATHNP